MPKGVICGGAVDGSNQLGAMVTCQAMTACPDGAGSPACDGASTKIRSAGSSQPIKANRRRPARRGITKPSLPVQPILALIRHRVLLLQRIYSRTPLQVETAVSQRHDMLLGGALPRIGRFWP